MLELRVWRILMLLLPLLLVLSRPWSGRDNEIDDSDENRLWGGPPSTPPLLLSLLVGDNRVGLSVLGSSQCGGSGSGGGGDSWLPPQPMPR